MADPLELLTSSYERKPTFLANIWNPLMCTVGGFGMAMFINWGFRKPVMSGVQQHIALATIGGAIGVFFDRRRSDNLAKRDAVLRHYVELHPEDFPVRERKKYGDVLERWAPIR